MKKYLNFQISRLFSVRSGNCRFPPEFQLCPSRTCRCRPKPKNRKKIVTSGFYLRIWSTKNWIFLIKSSLNGSIFEKWLRRLRNSEFWPSSRLKMSPIFLSRMQTRARAFGVQMFRVELNLSSNFANFADKPYLKPEICSFWALLNKTYPSLFWRDFWASPTGAGVQGGSAPLLGSWDTA